MGKKKDLPAMPIYWGDIFKAPDVCSLPKDVRDTFFICLGRMWESVPRGYLMINKRKPTEYELASMLLMGSDIHMVNQHLNHLVEVSGVFSVNDDGIIYSRRIINDERNKQIKQENGKKGGNPSLLGKPEVNQKVILNHEDESEDESDYEGIINDLNIKAETKYKFTSKKTRQLINARIAEGFTVKDFITVNSKKVLSWKNDKDMAKFLRPETLYGTKFEGYLNELSSAGQTEGERMAIKHAGAITFANKVVTE